MNNSDSEISLNIIYDNEPIDLDVSMHETCRNNKNDNET